MKADEKLQQRVSNKFVSYFLNKGMGTYALEKLAVLLEKPQLKIKSEIYQMLRNSGIPVHWVESIFSVATKKRVKIPDHECISLKVGDTFIYSSNFDIEKIKTLQGQTLDICITGQVSSTEIKRFITVHADLIREIQKLLKLPKVKFENSTAYSSTVISGLFKDELGMSIKEVHESVEKDSTDPEYQITKKRIRADRKNRDKI